MLYDLMNNDMLQRANIALDSLSINARQLIYDGMIEEFNSRNPNDKIEDVNKKVLIKVVPQLVQYTKPQQFADDQLNTFLQEQPTLQVAPKNTEEENELLNGTPLFNDSSSVNEPKFKDTQIDLDISSADRNIWNPESKDSIYDFVVKFGNVDSNSRDIGKEKFAQNSGINIPDSLKNVIGVSLTHVILSDIGYNTSAMYDAVSQEKTQNALDKYPYLYLQIDEFSGKFVSSSDHGRKSFVKLIKDKTWKEGGHSNVCYHLMNTKGNGAKPSVGWISDTPIADVSKMSIRILKPSGYVLEGINDIFDIDYLTEEVETIKLYLKSNTYTNNGNSVNTDTAWTPDTLQSGHRILFNNVSFDNNPQNRAGVNITDIDGLNRLSKFLNSNEHIIVGHSFAMRYINISKKQLYYLNAYPGTKIFDSFGLRQEGDVNASSIDLLNVKLMNVSIQTNLGFNIKSREYLNENKSTLPI
tara:strand:- start:1274 stop:2683 length:1410 start_codon:yes stop_codon:yes gene_type:complete